MNIGTLIAVITLVIVVSLAARHIYREKKRGAGCIGCPFADGCRKHPRSDAPGAASCKRWPDGSAEARDGSAEARED